MSARFFASTFLAAADVTLYVAKISINAEELTDSVLDQFSGEDEDVSEELLK